MVSPFFSNKDHVTRPTLNYTCGFEMGDLPACGDGGGYFSFDSRGFHWPIVATGQ